VNVRILGPPAVHVAGAWLPLRPTKPHALLAYVAYRDAPVRRAEMATLMWPDADAEHAQCDVRQALRNLARGPFAAAIGRDRTGVWLCGECDVHAFRAAVAEGRWSDAFALHDGPLLQGFEIDDADEYAAWLASERSAVAGDWRRVCRALGREAAGAGRHDDAQRYADLLVAADPVDERAVREAMKAAAAAGDRLGAARRFEELSARLEAEFGMAPEPMTWAVYERSRTTVALPLADGEADAVGSASAPLGTVFAPYGATAAPRAPPRRFPYPAVLGREREIAELAGRLQREEVRLITLLGPGGIGKTTLARSLVRETYPLFPDGAFIASLGGAIGPDAVALAAARAMGLQTSPHVPALAQVLRALAGRRALLVLDGFEPHLDEVTTVDALLRETEFLRLLVTSRVRLRHAAENVVEVEPLETRGDGPWDEAAPSSAAQLFFRAATARLPPATVRGFDLAAVERIARALGGHPLAIELAAAWVDVLGLDQLEEQLQRSWAPLRSDEMGRAPRQRDVQATIEEAWQHLDPVDRAAWARLALLPGSIDRGVATSIAGVGWRGLRRLLDRAVLRHHDDRFELHALLARFGRERAAATGLEDAAWAGALAVWRVRIAHEMDPRSGHRLRLHPHDLEQALGAWRWALARGEMDAIADMSLGLFRALEAGLRDREIGPLAAEAVDRLRRVRARWRSSVDPPGGRRVGSARGMPPIVREQVRATERALARLWTFVPAHRLDVARNARRALTLAHRHGDERARAVALAKLVDMEATVRVATRFASARAAFERCGDRRGLAEVLLRRSTRLTFVGRHDEAAAMAAEALGTYRELDDRIGQANVHNVLALPPLLRGDLEGARQHLRTARDLVAAEGPLLHVDAVQPVEVWLALVAEDRTAAAERLAGYVAWSDRLGGNALVATGLRCMFHVRFGTTAEAIAQARLVLEVSGAPRGVVPLGAYAHVVLATLHARAGDPATAEASLAEAARMTRALDAPRFVAHTTLAAAEVAAARAARSWAVTFAAIALHHPALDHDLRGAARALLERWGTSGSPPSEAADDDQALRWVEDLLAGLTPP
jgi:DNA-binding SARP family transcriptional activator/tetratricopeptide (TPR) repeat protein